MSASNYLEAQILDHIFRTASFTKPAALYVALFTVAPGEDGTGGTEVAGGSYARVQKDPGDANWDRTGSVVANALEITFPAPTADWGSIVAFGIYDAATSGNYLGGDNLTQPKTVNNGDAAPIFPVGTLTWTAD